MLAIRLAPIQPGMTDDIFVIQNQDALFLSKHGDWIDGHNPHLVFRTHHKDEAVNVRVEHSVRDPFLRLRIITCATNEKGEPRLADWAPLAAGEIDRTPSVLFTTQDERTNTPQGVTKPTATPAGADFYHRDSVPDFS